MSHGEMASSDGHQSHTTVRVLSNAEMLGMLSDFIETDGSDEIDEIDELVKHLSVSEGSEVRRAAIEREYSSFRFFQLSVPENDNPDFVEFVSKGCLKSLSGLSLMVMTDLDLGSLDHLSDDGAWFLLLLDRMRDPYSGTTNLRYIQFGRYHFKRRVLQVAAEACPRLKKISIGLRTTCDPRDWEPLGACKEMQEVSVWAFEDDWGSSAYDHVDVENQTFTKLAQSWRRLRNFRFINFRSRLEPAMDFLRPIGPSLVSLLMIDCLALCDEMVEEIVTNCPYLEIVNFTSCKSVTMKGLLHLRRLMFLKELKLHENRFSPAPEKEPGIDALFHDKEYLTHLDLHCDWVELSGETYFQILSLLPSLRRFTFHYGVGTLEDFILPWINSDAESIGLRRRDAALVLTAVYNGRPDQNLKRELSELIRTISWKIRFCWVFDEYYGEDYDEDYDEAYYEAVTDN